VIWFCDSATPRRSPELGRRAYLRQLNRSFYCMAGAVLEANGEVLRYIGDAVLAIFSDRWRPGRAASEPCTRAPGRGAGARGQRRNPDGRRCATGIGLHVGDVTYGNIGVPERLEFTVIGAAANEAARIEGMTRS